MKYFEFLGNHSIIRFRVTNGHSVESLFFMLNIHRKKQVSVLDFADAVSLMCSDITFQEALALGTKFDRKSRFKITVKDIKHISLIHNDISDIQHLLNEHSLFPPSITQRVRKNAISIEYYLFRQ